MVSIFEKDDAGMAPWTVNAKEILNRFIIQHQCALKSNTSFDFPKPPPTAAAFHETLIIQGKTVGVSVVFEDDIIEYKPVKCSYTLQNGEALFYFNNKKLLLKTSEANAHALMNYLNAEQDYELMLQEAASRITALIDANEWSKVYDEMYQSSSCVFSKLPVKTRLDILHSFEKDFYITDYKDYFIVDLIASLMTDDAKELYTTLRQHPELVINLYRGVDDENMGDRFHELIYACFAQYFAQVDMNATVEQKHYYISERSDKTIVSVEIGKSLGDLTITQTKVGVVNTNQQLGVNPMEPVGLYYSDWNNDPEGKKDVLTYLPAIYLKYLRDKTNSENTLQFALSAAQVAGVFAGAGLLTQGATSILRIAGVLELCNATANLVLIESAYVRNKLNATEDGKKFLELWPAISTVTDVATLGIFVTSARSAMRQLGDDFGGAERRAVQREIERAEIIIAESSDNIAVFVAKPLAQKLDEIATIWKTRYPVQEMLEGRCILEDIMGQYRYSKNLGWGHTADIAPNFKGVDFYYDFTIIGNDIFAQKVVSVKTTITKDVNAWLTTKAIKDNINDLRNGLLNNGILWNGKRVRYTEAEIHVYMPKENLTPQLKSEWLNSVLQPSFLCKAYHIYQ